MIDPASFNTLSPMLRDDPYSVYAALRIHTPVFWSEAEHAWILLRHQDVTKAFTDPSLLTLDVGQFVREISQALNEEPAELLHLLDVALFLRNPPAHQPLRSLVARLLTARSQASYAAEIDRLARRLLAPLARDGAIDLMGDYALPLPALVVGWLYGLSDHDALWLADTLIGVPSVLLRGRSMREYRSANRSLEQAHALLREHIRNRRCQPADDGLSLLVRLNHETDHPLDDHKLAALASFVFISAFETTSASIGNGLWWLSRQPDMWNHLAARPDLASNAVEETLRLEPPIQYLRRWAHQEQTIADRVIKAGDHMILVIAAANRDPDAYADPDQFMLDRTKPPVISFGAGAHHCLGGWLARLEARIALSVVLEGPRPTAMPEKPDWLPNYVQRRMKTFQVCL